MAKFSDEYQATAPARFCKYRKGEGWEDRHDRRYDSAQETRHIAQAWADEKGLEFRWLNGGHHWIFRFREDAGSEHFAQWWPRTAKLVVYSRWQAGIHAHDIRQVINELEKILSGRRRRAHRIERSA